MLNDALYISDFLSLPLFLSVHLFDQRTLFGARKKTLWRSLNECDKKWLFFSSVLVLIPSEFTLVNFQIASMWIRTRVMIQKKKKCWMIGRRCCWRVKTKLFKPIKTESNPNSNREHSNIQSYGAIFESFTKRLHSLNYLEWDGKENKILSPQSNLN